MRNRVAVVVPYFGNLPSYFEYFIQSVLDQEFDLLFFSDINAPKTLPKNVKWNETTFSELRELIENKLDVKTNLRKPYKLCDFRPAYGIIFDDYLGGYDF